MNVAPQRELADVSFGESLDYQLGQMGVIGHKSIKIVSTGEGTVSGTLDVTANFQISIPAFLVWKESTGDQSNVQAG